MREPFHGTLKELERELGSVGFTPVEDREYGALFSRGDGYDIQISFDRYTSGFSVELAHRNAGSGGVICVECLMQSIDPKRGLAASEALLTYGNTQEGVQRWWREFCGFLRDNQSIVFVFPLPEPYRSAYLFCCSMSGK